MKIGRWLLPCVLLIGMTASACGSAGAPPAPSSSSAPAAGPASSTTVPAPTTPATSQKQDVTLVLDWLFQGPNDGFMVARSKGFYDQAGLNVTIQQGKGSITTAQVIASGSATFGFSDGFVVAALVAKGAPLKMVASVFRRNPTGVEVLGDSPIKTPKDLEGRSVGIPTGATQFQEWPGFVKGCGLAGSRIHVVNVQAASLFTGLLEHQVDAIAGYVQGTVPTIEEKSGKPARYFWYADCGVTAVSNGIITRNDILQSEPDVVRRFVAASIKGFLYARQHPDEAIQILGTYTSTYDLKAARREMELSWQTWVTPTTKGKPLGWMSAEDWDATMKTLRDYGGVPNPPQRDQVYTNEFVPSGAEYVPPQ